MKHLTEKSTKKIKTNIEDSRGQVRMKAGTSKYASTLDLSRSFIGMPTRLPAFLSAHRAHNIIRWLRKEHFLTNEINIQNYLRSDRRLLPRIAILIEDSNSLAA
jgi:hypothetical protein